MVNLPSLWKHCRAVACIVCLGILAGCATDSGPKTADGDPLAKQARQLRANSTSSDLQGTGLGDRSREVEKDLGLR
jgi:uncharacterized lipoprotein